MFSEVKQIIQVKSSRMRSRPTSRSGLLARHACPSVAGKLTYKKPSVTLLGQSQNLVSEALNWVGL